MTNLSPNAKLAAAVMRVVEPPIAMAPYFGAVLRGLIRREMSPETEAMMISMGMKPTLFVTNDGVMQWSASFIASIDVVEVAWSLIHEVGHVVLNHHARAVAQGIPVRMSKPEDMNNARLWNLACFPPGTLVGSTVPAPIENVRKGEKLLGDRGAWGAVRQTMQKQFDGELSVIRASCCLPIEATPEHPVLVSRRHLGRPIRLKEPEWVKAEDVKVGDYVYFGVPSTTTDVTRVSVKQFTTTGINGRGANRVILKDGFPLTEDTAWLLGLWTAEGSGGEQCTLSLNANETVLAKRAAGIASSLGFSSAVEVEADRNTLRVYIGSTVLSRALWAWCGRGAHNKHVPEFILTHRDVRIREAFLEGVMAGDGYFNEEKGHHTLAVVSQQLVLGVQMLLAMTGRFGWMSITKQKSGRKINGHVLPDGILYRVGWSTRANDVETRVLNGKVIKCDKRRWKVTARGIATPVTAVSRRVYKGPVYNFSTSTHTYTAGGLVVHNCDASWNAELRKMNSAPLPGFWVMPETLEQPEGLIVEERYNLLRQQVDKIKQKLGKAGVGMGSCGSCSGHAAPGEPEGGKSAEGRSEAEMERFKKQVAQDIQSAKDRGTIPESLKRWADSYLAPAKIDWRTKLARIVRGAVAYRSGCADFTYSKMSRRQAGVGYGVGRPVVPALHSPKPTAACVIDTSGSMGKEALDAALTEVRGVLQAVGAGITVCICDAEVHGIKRVESIDEVAKMMTGGGGTAMAPALEAVTELKEKPSVCIVLTDGYVDDPPEPPFSVIWCIIGGNTTFSPSYGETVFVDEE